jgi:hypothetical protein
MSDAMSEYAAALAREVDAFSRLQDSREAGQVGPLELAEWMEANRLVAAARAMGIDKMMAEDPALLSLRPAAGTHSC